MKSMMLVARLLSTALTMVCSIFALSTPALAASHATPGHVYALTQVRPLDEQPTAPKENPSDGNQNDHDDDDDDDDEEDDD